MFPVYPEALVPLSSHEPGQPIQMRTGRAPFRGGTIDGRGDYLVSLELLPSPWVRVQAEAALHGTGAWAIGQGMADSFAFQPYPDSNFVELTLRQMRGFKAFEIIAQPRTLRTVLGVQDGIGGIGFGLHNLPLLYQPVWEGRYSGPCPPNRVLIEIGDWIAIVHPRSDISNVQDHLSRFGTFAVTHVGVLRTVDESPFALADADGVLKTLFWLVSFVRGTWGGPLVQRLLDPLGKHVGEVWEAPKVDAAVSASSWMDSLRADSMQQIANPMHCLLTSPETTDVLRSAIHWYITCNKQSGGATGSVVLCQAAIELLAWHLLVQAESTISKQRFESLKASDRIRLVLRRAKIPSTIPSGLPDLGELAATHKWIDLPHALSAIRNAIVHPGDTALDVNASPIAVHFAWLLGVQLLELLILNLLEYKGTYRCRVTRVTFPVPWTA